MMNHKEYWKNLRRRAELPRQKDVSRFFGIGQNTVAHNELNFRPVYTAWLKERVKRIELQQKIEEQEEKIKKLEQQKKRWRL